MSLISSIMNRCIKAKRFEISILLYVYLLIFSVLYFKIMITIVHMSLKQHYNKIIFIFVVLGC